VDDEALQEILEVVGRLRGTSPEILELVGRLREASPQTRHLLLQQAAARMATGPAPAPQVTRSARTDDLAWPRRRPTRRRGKGAVLVAFTTLVGLVTGAGVAFVNLTLRPAGFEALLAAAGVVFAVAVAAAELIPAVRDHRGYYWYRADQITLVARARHARENRVISRLAGGSGPRSVAPVVVNHAVGGCS
jgi:hypothetical protein